LKGPVKLRVGFNAIFNAAWNSFVGAVLPGGVVAAKRPGHCVGSTEQSARISASVLIVVCQALPLGTAPVELLARELA
jgi:hypothetical protein